MQRPQGRPFKAVVPGHVNPELFFLRQRLIHFDGPADRSRPWPAPMISAGTSFSSSSVRIRLHVQDLPEPVDPTTNVWRTRSLWLTAYFAVCSTPMLTTFPRHMQSPPTTGGLLANRTAVLTKRSPGASQRGSEVVNANSLVFMGVLRYW